MCLLYLVFANRSSRDTNFGFSKCRSLPFCLLLDLLSFERVPNQSLSLLFGVTFSHSSHSFFLFFFFLSLSFFFDLSSFYLLVLVNGLIRTLFILNRLFSTTFNFKSLSSRFRNSFDRCSLAFLLRSLRRFVPYSTGQRRPNDKHFRLCWQLTLPSPFFSLFFAFLFSLSNELNHILTTFCLIVPSFPFFWFSHFDCLALPRIVFFLLDRSQYFCFTFQSLSVRFHDWCIVFYVHFTSPIHFEFTLFRLICTFLLCDWPKGKRTKIFSFPFKGTLHMFISND